MVIQDATPLTPSSAKSETSTFMFKQHTLNALWGPEKYNYIMMLYGVIFYSRHTGIKYQL